MSNRLLSKLQLGAVELPNRMVMAPLTRIRADMPGHVPNQLMAEYYSQRAPAGLLIAEATMATPDCSAFYKDCGIFDRATIDGWKLTTDAVHAKGGRIFLQIYHGGRACHSSNNAGKESIAPFPIALSNSVQPIFNPHGKELPSEVPRQLTDEELPAIVEQFAQAARNAKEAGFDGVEVHNANGFLLDSFCRAPADARSGPYGGSIENRCRLTFEVLDAVVDVMGPGRTGVRISPLNSFQDLKHEDPIAYARYFAEKANDYDLAYLHLMRADFLGAQSGDVVTPVREVYNGNLIVNMGYSIEEGEATIAAGGADAICYGTKFLANPDLVERVAAGAELNEPNPATFYVEGATGYTDYPTLKQQQ